MKPVIGVNNPYGLIQKAGKKKITRRKKKFLRKKTRRYRK